MSETSQGSELQSETTALESAAPPSLTEGDKLIRESTQRCVFVGMQAFSGSYVCCFAVRELSKSLFIIAGVIAARRLWHGVCMEVYEAHLKLHKKKTRFKGMNSQSVNGSLSSENESALEDNWLLWTYRSFKVIAAKANKWSVQHYYYNSFNSAKCV